VVVVCLLFSLVLSTRRLEQATRELAQAKLQMAALHPLDPEAVAQQFETQTTLAPMSTKVRDVRYSKTQDAYYIEFAFTDAKTGQTAITGLNLKGDGFGGWYGEIRNDSFVVPLGRNLGDAYSVYVRTPSSISDQATKQATQ